MFAAAQRQACFLPCIDLMTAARQVLPNTTYLVTRRCAQRQLLLRPSAVTNQIFLYVLAVAAKRFDIKVHAYCVLSNHFHAIVTDVDARLPKFEQYLDSLVARAMNSVLGRWEAFWAPSSYSAVTLLEPSDVVDKSAYVLANPVAAGLVRSGREWPGLWSAPEQIGGDAIRVARPEHFFRRNGPMPQSAELQLTPPPGFESAAGFSTQLTKALECHEGRAILALESQERKFLGPKRVERQDPRARPSGCEPRRRLNPRIAGRDRWKRIEALSRLVGFLRAYRDARRAMQNGERNVVFPAGTYWLRVHCAVACAPAG